MPDAIFVDGGITQIKGAKEILNKLNLQDKIALYGMVKNDKHRTKALIDEERHEIKLSERLMNKITEFQDCVHDTAISYHKKLRDKQITKSLLDEIEGIGEAKKKKLLKEFGSIEGIKKAKLEELTKLPGITEKIAKNIKNNL